MWLTLFASFSVAVRRIFATMFSENRAEKITRLFRPGTRLATSLVAVAVNRAFESQLTSSIALVMVSTLAAITQSMVTYEECRCLPLRSRRRETKNVIRTIMIPLIAMARPTESHY